MSTVLPSLVSALAVIVAGVLVYLAARKENKISERLSQIAEAEAKSKLDLVIVDYREKWLQALRNEMAEVGSLAKRYKSLTDEQIIEFDACILKMLLLMNSNDPDFVELRQTAYGLRDKSLGKVKAKDILLKDYTDICQRILKREWDRLKLEIREAKKNVENK